MIIMNNAFKTFYNFYKILGLIHSLKFYMITKEFSQINLCSLYKISLASC